MIGNRPKSPVRRSFGAASVAARAVEGTAMTDSMPISTVMGMIRSFAVSGGILSCALNLRLTGAQQRPFCTASSTVPGLLN
jgi:hypothetical protein